MTNELPWLVSAPVGKPGLIGDAASIGELYTSPSANSGAQGAAAPGKDTEMMIIQKKSERVNEVSGLSVH